jgi:cell division protein FtsL
MSPPDQFAQVVREPDRSRLRAMGLALGLSGCLVGCALGLVGLKVQQVLLSYRLDTLRTTRVELGELTRQLRVELATLRSLARIEDKALTELGLARPSPEQVWLAREFVSGGDGTTAVKTAFESRTSQGPALR